MMLPMADGAGLRLHARRMRFAGLAAIVLLNLVHVGHASAATPVLDLAQYRGKVVVVDFWASWCKPCRQSLPWLNDMNARYAAEGLVVIGVNVDAERRDADRFLSAVPLAFDIVFDPQGEIAKRFKVQGMPSSFVFDRGGNLVESRIGFRDAKRTEHEAALQKLLSSPTS